MSDSRRVEMSDAEVDDFLGRRGTCVLALANDDTPYAVPVSYGYVPDASRFYLRLGSTDGGEKRAFVEPSARARIVVHDRTAEGWKSAVARGRLETLADEDLTVDVVEHLSEAELPHFEMWPVSKREVEFSIVRLDADDVTGRKAAQAGA
ncbi:MAG: pyridoxamine 5'-phosphate oxidase family protein [Haloferacaceae archaeon]